MAKKSNKSRSRKKANPWKRRFLYFIPITIGLIALILNVLVFKENTEVVQNIFNWTIGIGFIGGMMSLFIDMIVGKKVTW